MRLCRLFLEQFRSYPRQEIDFSEGNVHVFVGSNGAGKTNILEAISVLSLTKSCQGCDEQDLMSWGTEFYRVRAETTDNAGVEGTYEVVSQIAPRKQKACFVRDVKTPMATMVGQLPTAIFLPKNLQLFTGAPSDRRQFLDTLLCQVSPEYLQTLSGYQKVLKQRNALLKRVAEGANPDQLTLWDHEIAEKGIYVTLRRLELIEMLQCTLAEELHALGESWEDVQLVYRRKGEERDEDAALAEYKSLLVKYRERDVILQSTTVGPHREDWNIAVDGRDLSTFASRGQQRTAVLALLFLQVSYLELRRGEKPIILLDDVFSELDDAHQSSLLESLSAHQVIITTTHIPSEIHGARVHEVEGGVVKETVKTG